MSLKTSEIQRENTLHRASLLDTENATIVFFYDGNLKIGTVAFAMPVQGETTTERSSVLLGGKYLLASRALAERVAAIFKKMSLVSVRTELSEQEAFRVFVKLLDDVTKK